MKKLCICLAVAAISLLTGITSFAGQWQNDSVGWRYDNGDATYAQNGWYWIEGKCYYFTPEGYCLINTTTPDGYTVDGSGAWIVDGVVQTQSGQASQGEAVYNIGSLRVSAPEGFTLTSQDEESCTFVSADGMKAVFAASQDLGDDADALAKYDGLAETLIDYCMVKGVGQYTSRTPVQLESGAWLRYDYASLVVGGITTSAYAYTRIQGREVQMVVLSGLENTFSSADLDGMVNSCVK
ncbi:MAG: hypothetical protein ACI4F3_08380 [Enterocloster sp.]